MSKSNWSFISSYRLGKDKREQCASGLRIVINNTSLVPISDPSPVSVDGEVKKKEPLDAPPAARSETEIEYTIR